VPAIAFQSHLQMPSVLFGVAPGPHLILANRAVPAHKGLWKVGHPAPFTTWDLSEARKYCKITQATQASRLAKVTVVLPGTTRALSQLLCFHKGRESVFIERKPLKLVKVLG
jgi:hypothetical protein